MRDTSMTNRSPIDYRSLKFRRPGVYLPDVTYPAKIKKLLSYIENNEKRFEFTLKVADENGLLSKFTKYFPLDNDPESILSKFLYSMDAIGEDGSIHDEMLIDCYVEVTFRKSKLGNLYIATMFPYIGEEESQEDENQDYKDPQNHQTSQSDQSIEYEDEDEEYDETDDFDEEEDFIEDED